MEILVGKGGNQSLPITDESVSKIHCKIEILDSGRIVVTNISPSGTFVNGNRIIKRTIITPDDELRLGTAFSVKVSELIEQEDFSRYTTYQVVCEKYVTMRDLQIYLSTAVQRNAGAMPDYVMPVFRSALAYYKMEEGYWREAQDLLYESGDALYAMQDGSVLLQGVYATVLMLVAQLYQKVGRIDVALTAINGAKNIFDRIDSDDFREQQSICELFQNDIEYELNNK